MYNVQRYIQHKDPYQITVFQGIKCILQASVIQKYCIAKYRTNNKMIIQDIYCCSRWGQGISVMNYCGYKLEYPETNF